MKRESLSLGMSRLIAMTEGRRRDRLQSEGVRHAEFVRALRDPTRASDVVKAAVQEVEAWEARGNVPSEHSEGWRVVLALEPEAIAQLLEDQRHPLLHAYYQDSPFRRPETEEEHRRAIDKFFHRDEFAWPRAKSKDKCRLSIDRKPGARYCVLMADPDFSHPGALVRQNCLERFELSVTEGARVLGVSRQALTNLLSGKAGISPEMALRLDLAFGGGAETWLQRQVLHDLAEARKRLAQFKIVPIASERQPALF